MSAISPEEQEWTRCVTEQILELRGRVLDLEHELRMRPRISVRFSDGFVFGALIVAAIAAVLAVLRG